VEPGKRQTEFDAETERVASAVVDAAYQVHINIGPGLLESAYEACLVHELAEKGLKVKSQVPVPLVYKGLRLNIGFRLDVLVEDKVIIELKAVEELHELHRAQVITYLKLSGKKLGFLINFNTPVFKRGIERIVFSGK
jgi:GxxExxY protein